MASNGLLNFQGTNKATFVGATSNIALDVVNSSLGIGITGTDPPSSNLYITGNAYVTSDISVGGVLNMGVVNVAARHTLEAITSLGASTPSTLTLTNTGTSLVASGDVTVDTNTFHVDTTNNRVGIGTASPDGPLHISKSAPYNGDTGPGILFTRYSNTYGGCIWNESNNNLDGLYFNAVNNVAGAGYGSTPKMVINSNGNVGIGLTNPGYTLEVNGYTVSSGSGTDWINITTSGSINSGGSAGDPHNQSRVSIKASHGVMSATGFFQGSDDRVKSFETELNLGLNEIIQLQPKRYLKHPEFLVSEDDESGSTLPIDDQRRLYKSILDEDGNEIKKPMFAETEYGLISQHVESIQGLEILVTEDASENKIKNLNYIGFIPILINGIKELKTKNDTLEARFDVMDNQLQAEKEKTRALEDKVEALEDHLTRFTVQVTARLASQK